MLGKQKDTTGKSNQPEIKPDPANRKIEILGIIIMAIGLLIGVSIISYNGEDYGPLKEVTFSNMFSTNEGPALRIQNGLGPIGAWLGHFFVYLAFGYSSIIMPIIISMYGWYVFRLKVISNLTWQTVYSISIMILFAIISGWFKYEYEMDTIVWTGSSGLAIAQILRTITGFYGSMIILFVSVIISILFLIDRDIQITIDRFKEWIKIKNDAISAKKSEIVEQIQISAEKKKAEVKQANQKEKSNTSPQLSQTDTPIQPPSPVEIPKKKSVEEIVAESEKKTEERIKEKQREASGDNIGNRALLDKSKLKEDDLALNVYVGKDEEEANSRDIKKMQKGDDVVKPVIKYKFPTIDLLDSPPNEGREIDMEEINQKKRIILDKLARHNIEIIAIDAIIGPTVTLYELTPAPDVKISKIESYANDLKMAMAAHGLRIIAPIPGKSAVGIEVPNNKRETVLIKTVINTKKFVETSMDLPVAFGKTIENETFMVDLAKMPHLLMAGATGSGKSVGINTIITCLLYKCHPDDLKFVLVDPKKIELALYSHLSKHYLASLPDAEEPIITDTSKVLEVLTSVCLEMDERYDLLKLAMVRDLRAYNEKFKNGVLDENEGHRYLPFIVVIIDELADLMMTAGKQVEEPIARIAQLARAVGIHMVIATQRPSVNVITGTIKANFPARIAYQVASKVDSRTILDTMGADQLVGRGDMLFSGGGPMIRIQNAFVSTDEVQRITEFIGAQTGYIDSYHLPVVESEEEQDNISYDKSERDALFNEAAKTVVLHQQGSVSLIQRKLRLGYNRAGRIIDQLYAYGIVGPHQGSTAREVLIQSEAELEEILQTIDDE